MKTLKGKLMTHWKTERINSFIPFAAAYADQEVLLRIGTQTARERQTMWDECYHTEMNRMAKAEGLRV